MQEVVSETAVIECRNLSKTFTDGGLNVSVLKDVSLCIKPNELLAIVGASGSGKSTLLHILGGLDRPTSGEVFVAGVNLNDLSAAETGLMRNHHLGFVYQFHHLLAEFNALENVAMPLLIRGLPVVEARDHAYQLLEKVGLEHRVSHRLGELSGGERQRVAIARALVTKPKCILADEPTGNLDKKTAESIFELMLGLNQEMNTSFVTVTHDLSLAGRMGKVIRLENGVLVE